MATASTKKKKSKGDPSGKPPRKRPSRAKTEEDYKETPLLKPDHAPECIVVGVDPSLRNTGVTVWQLPSCTLLYQTTVKNPPKTLHDMKSYKTIYNSLISVFREYKPQAVFIERIFQSKSSDITQALFQAQFSSRLAAYDLKIPSVIVPTSGPTGWQTHVLGGAYKATKAGIKKILTRKKLQTQLGIEFDNEHIADSASIALTGAYFYFHPNPELAALGVNTLTAMAPEDETFEETA